MIGAPVKKYNEKSSPTEHNYSEAIRAVAGFPMSFVKVKAFPKVDSVVQFALLAKANLRVC
jgi:hypothetical protein